MDQNDSIPSPLFQNRKQKWRVVPREKDSPETIFLKTQYVRDTRKSLKRGYSFKPINEPFKGAALHHIHLKESPAFCIYLPSWLHSFFRHNSKTGNGLITVNAIAFSYWIIDFDLLKQE